MLLSPRKNGLTSLFKEVGVFKGYGPLNSRGGVQPVTLKFFACSQGACMQLAVGLSRLLRSLSNAVAHSAHTEVYCKRGTRGAEKITGTWGTV